MTSKSILSIVAIVAMSASANGQTYTVEDLGLGANGRIFGVYTTPDTDGNSLAIEFGIDFSESVASNTSIASVDVNDDLEGTGSAGDGPYNEEIDGVVIDNIGNNPFTGGETTLAVGTADLLDADQAFVPAGSGLLTGSTLAFTIEINDPIAVGDIVTGSVIAEDGTATPVSSTFGIFGDFDVDGDVDITDFGDFGFGFGTLYDIVDFGNFGFNFGLDVANNGAAAATATPEPSAAVLVAVMGVAGLVRRRVKA